MRRLRVLVQCCSIGFAPVGSGRRHVRRAAGFTLIELIVAVAIIGILATIAYPAYQQQIRKSRRAEAQSFLMSVAARQQQFLLDTRAYAATVSGVGVPVPSAVGAHYTLTLAVAAGPPPSYTLTATPLAAQAYETCGALSIDQAGAKTAATGGCW
jgi:type IV pilus assembly protein PilE